MFVPTIIKLYQTLWELWPAQDFGFRGDKCIKKKVRVVFLARDTPSGPYLYLYQMLSNYFKPLTLKLPITTIVVCFVICL